MVQKKYLYSFTLTPVVRSMIGHLSKWAGHGNMSRTVGDLIEREFKRQRKARRKMQEAKS